MGVERSLMFAVCGIDLRRLAVLAKSQSPESAKYRKANITTEIIVDTSDEFSTCKLFPVHILIVHVILGLCGRHLRLCIHCGTFHWTTYIKYLLQGIMRRKRAYIRHITLCNISSFRHFCMHRTEQHLRRSRIPSVRAHRTVFGAETPPSCRANQ